MRKWKRYFACLILLMGYLGLHNGYLALFEDGSSEPSLILPYKAELYPQADQEALKQGIPYETQEELTRLLEDFLS